MASCRARDDGPTRPACPSSPDLGPCARRPAPPGARDSLVNRFSPAPEPALPSTNFFAILGFKCAVGELSTTDRGASKMTKGSSSLCKDPGSPGKADAAERGEDAPNSDWPDKAESSRPDGGEIA